MDNLWLVNGRLVTPAGVVDGAVQIVDGKIAARRAKAPAASRQLNLRGRYLAPGFIDVHVWGDPSDVARDAVRHGTTAFLTALGPAAPAALARAVAERASAPTARDGAACLGLHLEGPYLNPVRRGVLLAQAMRLPRLRELAALHRAAGGRLRVITLAPELRGALAAIRWCRAHRIVASLGHTDADAAMARQAVRAGATAVTHLFNAMRPLHHRDANLVDVALLERRLAAMVIADGVHVSPTILRLALRVKGAAGLVLATDSVKHQARTWTLRQVGGAYRSRAGVLAGSALTMLDAVKNMVRLGGASLAEAVTMATRNPAALLGMTRTRGTWAVGARADLVCFDGAFRIRWTMVGGRRVYSSDT